MAPLSLENATADPYEYARVRQPSAVQVENAYVVQELRTSVAFDVVQVGDIQAQLESIQNLLLAVSSSTFLLYDKIPLVPAIICAASRTHVGDDRGPENVPLRVQLARQ